MLPGDINLRINHQGYKNIQAAIPCRVVQHSLLLQIHLGILPLGFRQSSTFCAIVKARPCNRTLEWVRGGVLRCVFVS